MCSLARDMVPFVFTILDEAAAGSDKKDCVFAYIKLIGVNEEQGCR